MTERKILQVPFTGGLQGKAADLFKPPGTNLVVSKVRQAKAGEWRNAPPVRQWAGSSASTQPYIMMGPVGAQGAGVTSAFFGVTPNQLTNAGGASLFNCFEFFDPGTSQAARAAGVNVDGSLAAPSSWHRRPEFFQSSANAGTGFQNPSAIGFATGVDSTNAKRIDCIASMVNNNVNVSFIDVETGAELGNAGGGFSNCANVKCAYTGGGRFAVCVLYNTGAVDVWVTTWTGTSYTAAFAFNARTGLAGAILDAFSQFNDQVLFVARDNATGNLAFTVVTTSTRVVTTSVTVAVAATVFVGIVEDLYATGNYFVIAATAGAARMLRLLTGGGIVTNDSLAAVTIRKATGITMPTAGDWMAVYDDGNQIFYNSKNGGVLSGSQAVTTSNGYLTVETKGWGAAVATNAVAQMKFVAGYHSFTTLDPQDTYYEMVVSAATKSATPQAHLLPLQAGTGITINGDIRQVGKRSGVLFPSPSISYSWAMALTHSVRFTRAGGQLIYNNGISTFTVAYPMPSTMPAVSSLNSLFLNYGRPVPLGAGTYVPFGPGKIVTAQTAYPMGPMSVPLQPQLAQAAGGGLTLLGTYLYVLVDVLVSPQGDIYRSAPSVPASITLTGANATVNIAIPPCPSNNGMLLVKTEIYRTTAGGTVYQKVGERVPAGGWGLTALLTFSDTTTDAALATGDFLYSIGEIQNGIPPRPSHLCVVNKRLWAVDADFRQRVVFSKQFRKGFMPEFVDSFYVDLTDAAGDITGLQALDDRLIVFKQSAIYVISGDGPDLTGAGATPSVSRIAGDLGGILGSVACSTGQEVWFATDREGIWKIDRSLQPVYAGSPVDDLTVTPSPAGAPYNVVEAICAKDRNEIWFIVTTGAGVPPSAIVYDQELGVWSFDTPWTTTTKHPVSACYSGSAVVVATSDAAASAPEVWYDTPSLYYTTTATFTPTANQVGSFETAWIEADDEAVFRLSRLRLVGLQVATSGAVLKAHVTIMFDKNTVSPKNIATSGDLLGTPYAGGSGGTILENELRLNVRCSSFKVRIDLSTFNASWQCRFQGIAAEISMLPGMRKLQPAQRMT